MVVVEAVGREQRCERWEKRNDIMILLVIIPHYHVKLTSRGGGTETVGQGPAIRSEMDWKKTIKLNQTLLFTWYLPSNLLSSFLATTGGEKSNRQSKTSCRISRPVPWLPVRSTAEGHGIPFSLHICSIIDDVSLSIVLECAM